MIEKVGQVPSKESTGVAPSRAIVELQNVSKHYDTSAGPVPVLQNVDLTINQCETVVVRGVSGSGKSTLLHILGAIDGVSSGAARVCGVELSTLSRREQTEFRARRIGFVFQFFNLIPTLTAQENVVAGLEPLPELRARRDRIAAEFLAAVGLADQSEKYPAQMSGGQQQRVAIARALAKRPELVLADEPTGALDAATAEQVLEVLESLKRESGAAVLIATHDPVVAEHADRVLQLRQGALQEMRG